MSAPSSGRIIHLNGTSSAGKTSIGRELQAILPGPHLLLGIDTFIRAMPPRIVGTKDGWRFVPAENSGLQAHEGPDARPVFEAMYAAVGAIARSGCNLIFDDVVNGEVAVNRMVRAFVGLDVTLVGVHCPVDVLEQRERARGDRAIGIARGMSEIVHKRMVYDVEVDTNAYSVRECAETIAGAARDLGEKAAFARLSKSLA